MRRAHRSVQPKGRVSMAELQQLIIGAVGTTLVIATLLFGVSKLNYRIDDRYVRVLLGPIPLRKVAIEDLRDARMGYRHWSESWTNTIYMPTIRNKAVTLYRRSGGFRRVTLTPDDPAGFIKRIKDHPRFVLDRP